MKLITQALKERFAHIGRQEHVDDPLVLVRIFNPCGGGTWLLTEYFPDSNTAFGYVTGLFPDSDEWGYCSISELEALRCPPLGLPLERDLHFEECPFSELKERGFQ